MRHIAIQTAARYDSYRSMDATRTRTQPPTSRVSKTIHSCRRLRVLYGVVISTQTNYLMRFTFTGRWGGPTMFRYATRLVSANLAWG